MNVWTGCEKQNEQAIRVSPNRLLVEDVTAVGYPRPAPLLAASDHVFFEDRTAGAANRSAVIYLFSSPHIKLYSASSFRDTRLRVDPESILPAGVMDSGLAPRAPRNDDGWGCATP